MTRLHRLGCVGGYIRSDLKASKLRDTLHRTIRPSELSAVHPFPMAQQFVSRLLPLGHAKSARSDDAHFLSTFGASEKWLRFDASVA